MAIEQGTATDYRDLLDRLRLFLTTNAALVAAGQAWTQLRWVTTGTTQELILKAPGLGGTDNIYLGVQSSENLVNDWFNWVMDGFTDYTPGNTFILQPGSIANAAASLPALNLWNSTIPYTFVANGRRVIIGVRVNTRYFQAYMGLLTPYSTPAQSPYPLAVMGAIAALNTRWSGVSTSRSVYYMTNAITWTSTTPLMSSQLLPTDDNVYVLFPTLLQGVFNNTTPQRYEGPYYGEFDGMFYVPGLGNVSDNIITFGGVDHLVVQDGPNTGLTSYMAIRLDV